MLPSRRNLSQGESFTVASPHVIYRSNWLERTPEIEDMLSLTIGNLSYLESSSLPAKIENNNTARDIILRTLISPSELREIEMFFYLFMRDLAYKNNLYQAMWEINEQSISSIEKTILASFFLDKDQIGNYKSMIHRNIYDLIWSQRWKFTMMKELEEKGIPTSLSNEYFEDPYSNNWRILLPNLFENQQVMQGNAIIETELNGLALEEEELDELWLEKELDGLRWINYVEKVDLKTRSYYHIQKGELMERVRHLLCKGLFNDTEPKTMKEIEELYSRLLNFRGAVMWMTASFQFPKDEVIFLWNRSMIGQSLERAWHLPSIPKRVDDSIQSFKVTHHRKVRYGNELVPIMDVEVWTNDQLRDVLGCDWMFDQRLVLENDQQGLISDESLIPLSSFHMKDTERYNWINVKKFVDLQTVRKILSQVISFNNLSINGGFLTEVGSNRLFLEEFNPRWLLEHLHNSKPINLLNLLPKDDEGDHDESRNNDTLSDDLALLDQDVAERQEWRSILESLPLEWKSDEFNHVYYTCSYL